MSNADLVTERNFAGYSDFRVQGRNADAADMQSLNPQFDLLGRLISASDLRQRVISNNIANVNTPNYRRLDVSFEDMLAKEMDGGRFGDATPQIVQTEGLLARADGNNVDIDREIGQLNKNAMLQQTWLQLLSTELDQMRRAIDGT